MQLLTIFTGWSILFAAASNAPQDTLIELEPGVDDVPLYPVYVEIIPLGDADDGDDTRWAQCDEFNTVLVDGDWVSFITFLNVNEKAIDVKYADLVYLCGAESPRDYVYSDTFTLGTLDVGMHGIETIYFVPEAYPDRFYDAARRFQADGKQAVHCGLPLDSDPACFELD